MKEVSALQKGGVCSDRRMDGWTARHRLIQSPALRGIRWLPVNLPYITY